MCVKAHLDLDGDGLLVSQLSRCAMLHGGIDQYAAIARATTDPEPLPENTLDTVIYHLERVDPSGMGEHVEDGTSLLAQHEALVSPLTVVPVRRFGSAAPVHVAEDVELRPLLVYLGQ